MHDRLRVGSGIGAPDFEIGPRTSRPLINLAVLTEQIIRLALRHADSLGQRFPLEPLASANNFSEGGLCCRLRRCRSDTRLKFTLQARHNLIQRDRGGGRRVNCDIASFNLTRR